MLFKCYWQSSAVDAVFILHFQLLAGAKVNELTKHRQTALHLAAQQDLATICSVLLENGVDFAAEDENGNNGLLHSFIAMLLFICYLLFKKKIFFKNSNQYNDQINSHLRSHSVFESLIHDRTVLSP